MSQQPQRALDDRTLRRIRKLAATTAMTAEEIAAALQLPLHRVRTVLRRPAAPEARATLRQRSGVA